MSTQKYFSKNNNDIINSAIEFYNKPEYYREMLRSSPKYFIHYKVDNVHIFGMSKFCAFKNISVEEYISEYRYLTMGGITQKYISKITGLNWIGRDRVDNNVRKAFDKWISEFFPKYNLNNASIISLERKKSDRFEKKSNKRLSPAELIERLKQQEEIGKIGELIALEYENDRLIKSNSKTIEHISEQVVNSGYDIYSKTKTETRFIEVKASLNPENGFYISSNELTTLTKLGDEAYIYLVHITNLKLKKGLVYKVYKNPFKEESKKWDMEPIIYKVKLNVC